MEVRATPHLTSPRPSCRCPTAEAVTTRASSPPPRSCGAGDPVALVSSAEPCSKAERPSASIYRCRSSMWQRESSGPVRSPRIEPCGAGAKTCLESFPIQRRGKCPSQPPSKRRLLAKTHAVRYSPTARCGVGDAIPMAKRVNPDSLTSSSPQKLSQPDRERPRSRLAISSAARSSRACLAALARRILRHRRAPPQQIGPSPVDAPQPRFLGDAISTTARPLRTARHGASATTRPANSATTRRPIATRGSRSSALGRRIRRSTYQPVESTPARVRQTPYGVGEATPMDEPGSP